MTSDASDKQPVIFLPGIILPAALRYAPLIRELGDAVQPLTKELEVYALDVPPAEYSIDVEVEGLSRAADAAGFERFHLFGHSGGGAIALAYIAEHPQRVLSLAVDEPASDFSEVDCGVIAAEDARVAALPSDQQMLGFMQTNLAAGVQPPPPPPGPSPPWMSMRPAGTQAFVNALGRHRIVAGAWADFQGPVLFTHGSLSHPRWASMRDRLAAAFPEFNSELFEGLHHFTPYHQTEPALAASALGAHWRL